MAIKGIFRVTAGPDPVNGSSVKFAVQFIAVQSGELVAHESVVMTVAFSPVPATFNENIKAALRAHLTNTYGIPFVPVTDDVLMLGGIV